MRPLKPDNNVVRCVCNGIAASGTYEVEEGDRFLVLTTPFGVNRVSLGVMAPRKIAVKLMKNVCMKATATKQCCGAPTTGSVPGTASVSYNSLGEPVRISPDVKTKMI